MYTVKYDYIGEDAIDCCYGIEERYETWAEVIEAKDALKVCPNAEHIEVIDEDY